MGALEEELVVVESTTDDGTATLGNVFRADGTRALLVVSPKASNRPTFYPGDRIGSEWDDSWRRTTCPAAPERVRRGSEIWG